VGFGNWGRGRSKKGIERERGGEERGGGGVGLNLTESGYGN